MTPVDPLTELGWSAGFAAQLDPAECETTQPARVTGVHRNRLDVLTAAGPADLIPASSLNTTDVAVGDWVLARDHVALRVLIRNTLLQRRAAGTTVARQLIAANVDTALITSSCNADFNVGRLERYLVLCAAAGIEPVLVLTKADACPDPAPFIAAGVPFSPGFRWSP